MAENGRVSPEDLELTSAFAEYEGKGLGKARQELERHMIESAIARNHGNLTRTALELEISRPTLYELMEKLSISRKSA
jgi:two-component system, NtrC family, response regulator